MQAEANTFEIEVLCRRDGTDYVARVDALDGMLMKAGSWREIEDRLPHAIAARALATGMAANGVVVVEPPTRFVPVNPCRLVYRLVA